MPIPSLTIPLSPGRYYHVYNRGNNKERIFHYEGNYNFFMEKYFLYLGPYVETYGYCLLPNHFHFLIRINDDDVGPNEISNQFRRLFICYARCINNQQNRSGCLLSKNYRRVEVDDEMYLKRLILYIHHNPVKHGITRNFNGYPYSSFSSYLSFKSDRINTNHVFHWFDGAEGFFNYHNVQVNDARLIKLVSDD